MRLSAAGEGVKSFVSSFGDSAILKGGGGGTPEGLVGVSAIGDFIGMSSSSDNSDSPSSSSSARASPDAGTAGGKGGGGRAKRVSNFKTQDRR